MAIALEQDKRQEVAFFDGHAERGSDYNVFTERSNRQLIQACIDRTGARPGDRILDLGCGSGIFSHRLAQRGLRVVAVDISAKLTGIGRRLYPEVEFQVGDAERLPFSGGVFDAAFLGGVIHHFPDPAPLAREVARVVKAGGTFFAFDPNRHNPFMYLYRVRSSPFYSPAGVTPNEQPVRATEVMRAFELAGFDVETGFASLRYIYVASGLARLLLPLYNLAESALFWPPFLKQHRAFLLTWGRKRESTRALAPSS